MKKIDKLAKHKKILYDKVDEIDAKYGVNKNLLAIDLPPKVKHKREELTGKISKINTKMDKILKI